MGEQDIVILNQILYEPNHYHDNNEITYIYLVPFFIESRNETT